MTASHSSEIFVFQSIAGVSVFPGIEVNSIQFSISISRKKTNWKWKKLMIHNMIPMMYFFLVKKSALRTYTTFRIVVVS